MICEHCKSRYSWDCDDGYAYPKHGCDDFSLAWDTLNDEQKRIIFDLLDEKEKTSYWE